MQPQSPRHYETRETNDLHPGQTWGLAKRTQEDIQRGAQLKRDQREAELREKECVLEAQAHEIECRTHELAVLEEKLKARQEAESIDNILAAEKAGAGVSGYMVASAGKASLFIVCILVDDIFGKPRDRVRVWPAKVMKTTQMLTWTTRKVQNVAKLTWTSPHGTTLLQSSMTSLIWIAQMSCSSPAARLATSARLLECKLVRLGPILRLWY